MCGFLYLFFFYFNFGSKFLKLSNALTIIESREGYVNLGA